MRLINGEGAILGRVAAYAAKESLKGEEINIINCEKLIVTGNKSFNEENFRQKKTRVGSTFKGPKISKDPQKMVKRVIRGMLPEHRWGRGREAFKKIKCFVGTPKEFEGMKPIEIAKTKRRKYVEVKEIIK